MTGLSVLLRIYLEHFTHSFQSFTKCFSYFIAWWFSDTADTLSRTHKGLRDFFEIEKVRGRQKIAKKLMSSGNWGIKKGGWASNYHVRKDKAYYSNV